MNILLVEDDQLLGEGIQHALVKSGETITWLQDGQSALDTLVQDDYDLVLLDLGLPRKDGLAVLKELRQRGKPVPVMILTARDTVDDRVEGLDLGADDYLIKPFSLDELKARIRALHRRACGRADPVLAYKDIVLNPARHSVAYKDEDVVVSRREYSILEALLEHPGRVLSKNHLEQAIYGWEDSVESNAVEVHIHHLRRKLYPELIRTVRGVGYTIDQ